MCVFVTIFSKVGSNRDIVEPIFRPNMRLYLNLFAALGALTFFGCAPSRSLFIQMYDPKTNRTLNCSAQDAPGEKNEFLYDMVENCARQLEAHGFVRVQNAPASTLPRSTQP